jgi:hypothetical protein
MPKILFNKPWLLPVVAFLTFVALWVAFIFFAVKHKPREVERVHRQTSNSLVTALKPLC